MENPAGIFQIEKVMGRNIRSGGIPELVEVVATMDGRKIKTI
jgi:metal-dependent HD superfamily phosphatase/phosphodiesterase